MARKVFYSFHYQADSHRVQQVKNMGAVEGQPLLGSNDWEKIENAGDSAIEKWITENMAGKSCNVVLIGAKTAGRKWVEYEIVKAWNDGKGVLGVYIHNLKDLSGSQSSKGANPFASIDVGTSKKKMSTIVNAYDPPYSTSTYVYDHVKDNLADWVEESIKIRDDFKA
jgi:hypothetical protein